MYIPYIRYQAFSKIRLSEEISGIWLQILFLGSKAIIISITNSAGTYLNNKKKNLFLYNFGLPVGGARDHFFHVFNMFIISLYYNVICFAHRFLDWKFVIFWVEKNDIFFILTPKNCSFLNIFFRLNSLCLASLKLRLCFLRPLWPEI